MSPQDQQPAKDLNNIGLLVNTNVAGDAIQSLQEGTLVTCRYGDKAIDYKACKLTYKRFGIKTLAFEALSILWVYLEFTGCHIVGCSLLAVANWAGFKIEKRIGYQFDVLIGLNAVDKIPFNGGHRYLITAKGLYILRYWDEQRVLIIEDIEKRRIIARLKAETKLIRRSMRKRDAVGRYS